MKDELVIPRDAAAGGPWTDEDHAENPAFDERLAFALLTLLEPIAGWDGARVVDWGGGRGHYLERFAFAGAATLLVEPYATPASPSITRLPWDMTRPFPWLGGCALAMCLEVMEHIPFDDQPTALDNICGSVAPGGLLVFSGATPGQGGIGHVGERHEMAWALEMEKRGMLRVEQHEAGLRREATLPWFKKNIMVFVRQALGAWSE